MQMDWTDLGVSNDVQQIINNAAPLLASESFTHSTAYDALNRPIAITTPDSSVIRPAYNERRLLRQVAANVRGAATAATFIQSLAYNEKGQRTLCSAGHGAAPQYAYGVKSFRLLQLPPSRSGDNAALQDLTYHYDPIGN